MNNNISERLTELKIEDYIWIIYVAIIFLSWIANSIERNYFLTKNSESKENYRKIMVIIFCILVAIYSYFFKDSLDNLQKLKQTDTERKKSLTYLSFIASLLILISGLILLYIAVNDEDIDVELAFN